MNEQLSLTDGNSRESSKEQSMVKLTAYLPVQTEENNEIICSLINIGEWTLIKLIFFYHLL